MQFLNESVSITVIASTYRISLSITDVKFLKGNCEACQNGCEEMRDKYICLWSLIKETTRRKKSARSLFVLPGTACKSPGHQHKVINATQKKAGLQRQTLI